MTTTTTPLTTQDPIEIANVREMLAAINTHEHPAMPGALDRYCDGLYAMLGRLMVGVLAAHDKQIEAANAVRDHMLSTARFAIWCTDETCYCAADNVLAGDFRIGDLVAALIEHRANVKAARS